MNETDELTEKIKRLTALLSEAGIALLPVQYANIPQVERDHAAAVRAKINDAVWGAGMNEISELKEKLEIAEHWRHNYADAVKDAERAIRELTSVTDRLFVVAKKARVVVTLWDGHGWADVPETAERAFAELRRAIKGVDEP